MVAIVSIWLLVVARHIPKFGDRCIHFKVVINFVVSTASWKVHTHMSEDLPCRYRYRYVFILGGF